MLQTFEFDVNRERDSSGDLLLHKAVRQGLSHLALILNLVQVHEADVEASDAKGMTPLCIAAHLGHAITAEVCTFHCCFFARSSTKTNLPSLMI